jgi:hypothetical protein
MKCYECGGNLRILNDRFEYNDSLVGQVHVQGIPYYKCDKNGEILFTLEMSKALDIARAERIQELLGKYPATDFIFARKTAEILGITRQALHKNRRIKRGFIYHINIDGVVAYLRQSVQLFKETGDGRFPLNACEKSSLKYIESTVPLRMKHSYQKSLTLESVTSHSKKAYIRSEEVNYAN